MKPTLLFATLSMVLASPTVCAKSELETLRLRCTEQERQIRQLENENTQLRSGTREAPAPAAKSAPVSTTQAAAVEKAAAPSSSTYVVKAGDSMEKIARKVGTSPLKLAKSNGLKTSSMIHPGQKLKVPGAATTAPAIAATATPTPRTAVGGGSHKVQPGETFASISRKHGMSTEALVAANPKVKATALRPGQVVNLGGDGPSTTMISAPTAHAKAPASVEKAPTPPVHAKAPAPAASAAKSPAVQENIPVSTPAPASVPAVAEKESLSPNPEKKIRPVMIEGEMTYGEFATKHGTDAARLNALNGLDLTTATILAKGSELYVPAQP